MKAFLFPLGLLICCLANFGLAEREGYIRRQEPEEVSNRPAPYAVGDKYSTKINESFESVIPGQTSEDGSQVKYEIKWRQGASYTTVHFEDFNLDEGCKMQVSGKDLPDGTPQAYKMTGRGKMMAGTFWTQHVKGDTMTLDIRCPSNTEAKKMIHFEIDEVAVGFVEEEAELNPFGESTCGTNDNQNAICYVGTTQYTRARAVARLLIGGSSLCTGWLVSSSGHLITNEHCISSANAALNTDFDFGAEAPTCGSGNCQSCHQGTVFSGATYIQDSAALDYAIMQFRSQSPQSTFGFLELDVRSAVLNEQIYIPQHPSGRAKEFGIVSTHSQNPSGFCKIDSFSESGCTGSAPDYGYYCDTEGGSSGSPVLASSSNKVIALHHCRGNSACSQTGGDPNRGVPITLIYDEISSIIGGAPSPTATPPPTPSPTPAGPVSCPSGQVVFTLDLLTDRFGDETTWRLLNACTGANVQTGGPYATDVSTQYIENYCVASGARYTFTIFDSFGDGICCLYGNGSYRISFDGVVVGSGATFTFSQSHTFGHTCPSTPSPTPSPTPAPTPASTNAPAIGICFSEVATVPVQNQGLVKMPELHSGDKVLTANGYRTLYAFAHKDSQTITEFLQIHTEEYPHPLEISGQHLLFVVGKPHPVPAHSIQPGDMLQSTEWRDGVMVRTVTSVHRDGMYAPLTLDGTVVVNGIVSSCYVALQRHAGGYVELQGGISTGLSHHFLAHLTMTPVRIACLGISADLCKSYDEDGLAYFAKIGFAAAEWADTLSFSFQVMLLPVYLLAMGSLFAVEFLFGPKLTLWLIVGLVVAVAQRLVPKENQNGSKSKRVLARGLDC